jgi:hypothetical protein
MTRIPDFFIVGAPKCGTTSMYEYLRVHPDIFMPKIKEPHYFGSDLDIREDRRTRDVYLALFDEAGTIKRAGESSVLYLYSTCAAREIHAFNPAARILIMLREPVSAMISWHGQLVSMAIEGIYDFEKAVGAQEDRKHGRQLPTSTRLRSGLQYTSVFSYAEQVQRYLNVFDRSQVHVVLLDDVTENVAAAYRGVLEFLDVDPTFTPDFAVHNEKKWLRMPALTKFLRGRRGVGKLASRLAPKQARKWTAEALARVLPSPERPPIRPEFISALRAACKPDIDRLSTLIRRDLSHWCTPMAPRA